MTTLQPDSGSIELELASVRGLGVLTRWPRWVRHGIGHLRDRVGRSGHAELVALAESVGHVASHSEGPFLELGRDLQQIHRQARALQLSAKDSVQAHSSEVTEAWLPRLQALVQALEQQLKAANGQLDLIEGTLSTVDTSFAQSRSSLRTLNANVLTLRMLATLTRIESAHLAQNARGILLLAEEVGNQANDIAERAQTFLSQSEGLLEGMREAHQRVERLQRTQRHAGPLALQRIAQVLEALVGHRDATRQRLEETERLSREIAVHTSEVVASLQFHDITRQRLEHVAAALRGPGIGRRLERGPLLRLQAGQVEHAGQDLREASERVSASLLAIAEATGTLAEHLADDSAPAGNSGSDGSASGREPSTDLEQQLGDAVPALQDVHRGAQEITSELRTLSGSLAQVFSLHRSLTGLAREVEVITESIKRVGINATIRASALGQAGAPLAALAQAVQRFSSSVGDQSRDLGHLLASMDDAAASMQSLAEQDREVGEQATSGADLDELLNLLDGVHRGFAGRLIDQQRMARDSRALAEAIGATARSFRAHHTLLAEMDGIQERLLRLAEQIGDRGTGTSINPALAPLEATYTMARERETHRRLLTGSSPSLPPPGSLRMAALSAPASGHCGSPDADAAAPPSAENELGDNVELF